MKLDTADLEFSLLTRIDLSLVCSADDSQTRSNFVECIDAVRGCFISATRFLRLLLRSGGTQARWRDERVMDRVRRERREDHRYIHTYVHM